MKLNLSPEQVEAISWYGNDDFFGLKRTIEYVLQNDFSVAPNLCKDLIFYELTEAKLTAEKNGTKPVYDFPLTTDFLQRLIEHEGLHERVIGYICYFEGICALLEGDKGN